MLSYKEYLEKTGEIGGVEAIMNTLIHVTGLPGCQTHELIIFEDGQVGYALSLTEDYVEVLLLSRDGIKVGSQVTRTDEFLEVDLGPELLGKNIDPLGNSNDGPITYTKKPERRRIDISPPGILEREPINQAFETGVTLVDLIVPMGRGQRELVIGDRKTGKTGFLQSTVVHQAKKGAICIYAAMGRRASEIKRSEETKFTIKGEIILFLIYKTEDYMYKLISLLKQLSNERKIIYISYNKIPKYIKKVLKENKFDMKNIVFINGVDIKSDEDINIRPEDLTKLSIIINETAKKLKNVTVVVDTISAFSTYHNDKTICQFVASMNDRARNEEYSIIWVAIDEPAERPLNLKLSQLCDKTIKK